MAPTNDSGVLLTAAASPSVLSVRVLEQGDSERAHTAGPARLRRALGYAGTAADEDDWDEDDDYEDDDEDEDDEDDDFFPDDDDDDDDDTDADDDLDEDLD